MNTLELKLQLSDSVLGGLQEEASHRNVLIDAVIQEILENYFDEPTDEEILEGFRRGMLDALAGRTVPAREALAEIEQELAQNND